MKFRGFVTQNILWIFKLVDCLFYQNVSNLMQNKQNEILLNLKFDDYTILKTLCPTNNNDFAVYKMPTNNL
jgi:hypothetical protein